MNVLVTGSSGLVGSALTRRLSGSDHRMTRLVRPGALPSPAAGVGDVTWDPSTGTVDRAGLEAAGPFDGVVHLAGAGIGERRWTPARKQLLLESRTHSTGLLSRTLAALPAPPRVLVSASAVGYYGDRGDEVLTEESPAGRGFLAELCRSWERATAPAAESGIRTVLLRTGIVLSPTGGALGRQLPLFRVGLGGRTGSGRQYRSWITLDDEVAAVLFCLGDAGLSGAVNATAPVPATDAELARAIGATLRRPTVLAVPAFALRLVLGGEMADELVLSGQRVVPGRLTAAGFGFGHSELHEAVRSVLAPS